MDSTNRPITVSFNAGAAKSNQSSLTDPNIVESVIDATQTISGESVVNNGEIVTGVFGGAMSIQNGVLRTAAAIASEPESEAQRTIQVIEVTAGAAQIVSGADRVFSSGLKGVAAVVADTAAKVDIKATATIFGKVSSGFGALYSALTLIQPARKIHLSRKLIKELKNDDGSTKFDSKRLKELAPIAYAKIQGSNYSTVDQMTLSLKMREEITKELNRTIISSSISLGTGILTIVSAVLGFVFSGGIGAIIGIVIGLTASAISSVTDGKAMVESLKSAKGMSRTELVLKVVTIILAAITLALSVAFAPHIALSIALGVVGVLVMSVPISAIFYLKTKQNILHQEAACKQGMLAGKTEKARLEKIENERIFAKNVAKLDWLVKPRKDVYLSEYLEEYNENYEVNLKAMRAVNEALENKIFSEEELYRLKSTRSIVSYRSTDEGKGTAELFVERVKGQKTKVAYVHLEKDEMIDMEILDAISNVCDLRINGTLYTKAMLKKVITLSKEQKEAAVEQKKAGFREDLASGIRILGGKNSPQSELFAGLMKGDIMKLHPGKVLKDPFVYTILEKHGMKK